jgi:hypothetical protein
MVEPIVYTTHDIVLTGLDLTTLLAGSAAPLAETPSGVANGDTFVNTGREIFVHINGDGANAKTVTFSEKACSYGVEHDHLVTTPANKTYLYGPFPTEAYGTSIPVAYGGTGALTNVKVLVVRLPTMS